MNTRTYAVLQVSEVTYKEVRAALEAAGYSHAFRLGGGKEAEIIDMHGIALRQVAA
jgi:hypothetical protein